MDSFAITGAGDLDVVINNVFWRIVAEHEDFVGGARD